jgi:hypothetical protein
LYKFFNLFQQLKTASATAILAALSFIVWSLPVSSVPDANGDTLPLTRPASWAKIGRVVYLPAYYHDGRSSSFVRSFLPINRVHPDYQHPIYFQGSYRSPFDVIQQHQPSNFLYPYSNDVHQDLKDIDILNNGLQARRRTSFENVIMPSFDSVPRHASFTDKSFLAFFSKVIMPVRFVNRVSSFPNVRVSYKNITLTGIAIG